MTGWHRHRHRPGPTLQLDTTSEGGGDFYLATSGDLHLAVNGDFPMAMDTAVVMTSAKVATALRWHCLGMRVPASEHLDGVETTR